MYLASQSAVAGWTGDRDTCNAGATTQEYADATLLRVNYYRAMAGLRGTVMLSNVWSAKCQETALMMSVAGQLSLGLAMATGLVNANQTLPKSQAKPQAHK